MFGRVKKPAPSGEDLTPQVPAAASLPQWISVRDLTAKEVDLLLDRAIYRKDREQREHIKQLYAEVEELRRWVTMFCVILVLFLVALLVILIKYRRR